MSSEVMFDESSYLHVRISFFSSNSLLVLEHDSLLSVEIVDDAPSSDSGLGFAFSAVLHACYSSISMVLIFSVSQLFA